MAHRGRGFVVARDQENPGATRRAGNLHPLKTPAAPRTGLSDVKRIAQSTAGPQSRVLGKEDGSKSTARPQSRYLLQDKTNKAREGTSTQEQDGKPQKSYAPSSLTSPVLSSAPLPSSCLKTPSPNLLLVKQRAPEPTPGPDPAELESQRLEREAQQAAAQDALFQNLPVELAASETAKEMEFSDEYLCAFDMPDINAKDLLRSLWMPTTGVDSAFVESDPPIAEFVELDYKDLFCCPLPPSPDLKSKSRPLHSRPDAASLKPSARRQQPFNPSGRSTPASSASLRSTTSLRPNSRSSSSLSSSSRPGTRQGHRPITAAAPKSQSQRLRPASTSQESAKALQDRRHEQNQVQSRLDDMLGRFEDRSQLFQFDL